MMCNRSASLIASAFGSIVVAGVAHAQVSTAATDAASNYTTWGQGQQLQGGTGFTPWVHLFSIPSGGGFAGQFLATANNADLNRVGPTAWGMFSNDGGAGGSGTQKAASLRSFVQGPMTDGQTFSIDMEHGNVFAGNGNPNNGDVNFGWVGVVLRNGTTGQQLEDPFSPFGELRGALGVGFLGGATEYFVYDSVSSSGRSTGMPFTTDGVRVEVTLLGGSDTFNASVRLTNLSTNATTVTPARLSGAVDSFGIYSRNVELADAFFNRATLTGAGTQCDSIDFNNDNSLFDPQDIEAFLSVYSEGPCVPSVNTCNDIDFNNDTSVFDPCDIASFLVVYSEGPCLPCGQ